MSINIFKKKKLEEMTKDDANNLSSGQLKAYAVLYNPGKKDEIASFYRQWDESFSESVKNSFIRDYILPYLKK